MSRRMADSLEYRLAVAVSLGLLAFSLVAVGAIFYFDYQQRIAVADELERQMVRTMQAQAEVAAFAGNADIAQDVLDGLSTSENVVAVRLRSSNGFDQSRSRKQAGPQLARSVYPLRSPVDRHTVIGELQIESDAAGVRDRAIRGALGSALLHVLQIVLTGALLAFVFRRVVGKPISALARALAAIRPGSGERLQVGAGHGNDEIGLLSGSANRLLDAAESALEDERNLRVQVEAMEKHYRRIFETTHVGIMVLHADGRLVNSNPILLKKIIGIPCDGGHAGDCANFISAIFIQPEAAWAVVDEAASLGSSVAADLQLKTLDGSPRWAHCILSVSRDAQGQVEIIEGVLYDVTLRRRQEEEARQRAEVDALTGVSNRHGCELFIDRFLRHAGEDHVAVAVMLIDLDGFKAVNDTLGHAAGDAVLVAGAQRLRDLMRRSSDLVGRLGGDEFVVVAYNCGEDDALPRQIAGDIVASLARPIFLADGAVAQIGASVGIARYPRDGATRAALFEQADQAMYTVKRRGKNGHAFADGVESPVADLNLMETP